MLADQTLPLSGLISMIPSRVLARRAWPGGLFSSVPTLASYAGLGPTPVPPSVSVAGGGVIQLGLAVCRPHHARDAQVPTPRTAIALTPTAVRRSLNVRLPSLPPRLVRPVP